MKTENYLKHKFGVTSSYVRQALKFESKRTYTLLSKMHYLLDYRFTTTFLAMKYIGGNLGRKREKKSERERERKREGMKERERESEKER